MYRGEEREADNKYGEDGRFGEDAAGYTTPSTPTTTRSGGHERILKWMHGKIEFGSTPTLLNKKENIPQDICMLYQLAGNTDWGKLDQKTEK